MTTIGTTGMARAWPHAAAAALLLLGGCGIGGPAHQAGASEDAAAVVEMTTTLDFVPETITIEAGETVEWRNTSLIGHTVTTVPELSDSPERVRIPEGAEPFDSGNIPPGEIYQRRLDVPGEYVYFCIPHDEQGMWGTVIVQPAFRAS